MAMAFALERLKTKASNQDDLGYMVCTASKSTKEQKR